MNHRQGSEKPHQGACGDEPLEREITLKFKYFHVRGYKSCFWFVIEWDQRFRQFSNKRFLTKNYARLKAQLVECTLSTFTENIFLNIRFFSISYWLKLTI